MITMEWNILPKNIERGVEMNKKKRYWYRIFVYYCPLCGKEDEYRERQYSRKPKNRDKRITIKEEYDHCDD